MASQWPAPSPDAYLNIDAPAATSLPCCCCLTSLYRGSLPPTRDHRHVPAAEAVLGAPRRTVRLLRERTPARNAPSAASIAAALRCCVAGARAGAGLSAGEEAPRGGCGRWGEDHTSRKGHPCRYSQLFPSLLLHPQPIISICRPYKAVLAELGQNALSQQRCSCMMWLYSALI